MCSSCIPIIGPAGCGNPTAGDTSGLPPPEYHTTCVWTASGFPSTIDSVELRAPACIPPVALLAPAPEGDTVSNLMLGVEISGMYGPQLFEQ
jgi:hypothetical protein